MTEQRPIQLADFLAGTTAAGPAAQVEAPELGPGAVVFLRDLSLAATLRLGEMSAVAEGTDAAAADRVRREAMGEIFAACVCDATGAPLFPDEALSAENRAKVGKVPMPLLVRVVNVAQKRVTGTAAGDAAGKG